ncbi:MAG: hypothetical protein JSW34_04180 [Candidatus Zixiibacteriota bacterium]|nr:MAG: hypothetical protein JSW34_04180 [candidate division Zixibacteria bacterium]
MHRSLSLCLLYVIICSSAAPIVSARTVVCPDSTGVPQTYKTVADTAAPGGVAYAAQNVGNWVLDVSNLCWLGSGLGYTVDYFTAEEYEISSEFPKHSQLYNLYLLTYWVGGILNGDTLVSSGENLDFEVFGYELVPVMDGRGAVTGRSVLDPSVPGYEDAVSELDLVSTCTDTWWSNDSYWPDYFYGWPPKPLYIEITQSIYGWSSATVEDVVLGDLAVKNVGQQTIEKLFFGLYSRPLVGHLQWLP